MQESNLKVDVSILIFCQTEQNTNVTNGMFLNEHMCLSKPKDSVKDIRMYKTMECPG